MQTFVVRIWEPADPEDGQGSGFRGVVEHIGSGDQRTFHEMDELVSFLRSEIHADGQVR